MSDPRMVDAIHARMLVRYGAKWLGMWSGVDPELVKADWSRELSGLSRESVLYGLDNLPADFPPTVAQFRVLCVQRPLAEVKQLPRPQAANSRRVAEELRRLGELLSERGQKPLQWAYDLQDAEARGEPLTESQRQAWREAIEVAPMAAIIGEFKPIPRHVYPPAMREAEGGL